MSIPTKQSEWLAAVRMFCFQCCGKSHIAVRECQDTKCKWYECRFEPIQLTFFDSGYREIFYQEVEKIISEIHGEFNAEIIKGEYKKIHNGKSLCVHPNWWGIAIRRGAKRVDAKFIGAEKSNSEKRRGGYTGKWIKA